MSKSIVAEAFAAWAAKCAHHCAEAGITKPGALPVLVEATRLLVNGLAEKREARELHKRLVAAGLALMAVTEESDDEQDT